MVAFLALAILSACGQSEPRAPNAVAAQAQAEARIGPDGAAGISSPLAMNVQTVAQAARSYEVAEVQDQIEGEPFTKITLSRDGEVVFEILPAADRRRIHAIATRSAEARGPAGETIGRSAFGEAPFTDVMYCRTPIMHEDFSFTCSSAQDSRFWRAYRLPANYAGPREPFTAISPDAAVASTLVRMTWIAPGPPAPGRRKES